MAVLHSRPNPVATPRQWLGAKPYTLALSAGFFGFFAHLGMLRALAQAGLPPRRIVGVSAGALVGGLVAAGFALDDLEEELRRLTRQDFWDMGLPVGGLLKGRRFAAMLDRLLLGTGVVDVNACPTPFGAVVFDVLARHTLVLTHGSLNAAIRASCALPGLFRPVRVGARWCVDGGVRDRNGVSAMASGERVLVHRLKSASLWRHLSQHAMHTQPLADAITLEVPVLPRVTPFRLQAGHGALTAAYDYTARWLDQPSHGTGPSGL